MEEKKKGFAKKFGITAAVLVVALGVGIGAFTLDRFNSLCPRREAQQKHTKRECTSSVSDLKPLIINSDNLRLLFTK